MDPTPDMRPAAKGDFVKTPLAHLIVFIAERKLHGSLVLHGDDGSSSTVYFTDGAPSKVYTSYPGTVLGRVMLQLGLIDDDAFRASNEEREKSDALCGQILLSMGAIDEAQLVAGLREQMMRRLLKLFEKLGDVTTYAFYAEVNLLSDYGGPEVTPIDSFRVVWEGMHLRPNDPSIDPTLARLGSAPVGLRPGADLRRFGFGPPELKIIELLQVRPMSLAAVLELNVMPIRQLKLLMYALLITKSIQVVAAPKNDPDNHRTKPTVPNARAVNTDTLKPEASAKEAPGGNAPPRCRPGSSPDDPPPSSARVPMARVKLKKSAVAAANVTAKGPPSAPATTASGLTRQNIVDRAERIEKEDYFQALGIARSDPPDVARSAYFALAKRWHPDRLPEELADVRDQAGKVFARITDAFQTLSDGERHAQYVEALEKGASEEEEQAKVQQVIEATLEYQKAEVFLRKRELDKALKSAQKAYEGDPEQAHHVALYAWTLAQQPEAQKEKRFDEALALLDQAIKLHDRCENALFYRAMLLKQLGKSRLALKDFKTVVDINPRNIDATREVRLAGMRGDVADDAPKGKGKGKDKGKGKSKAEAKDEAINWTQDSVGDIVGKLFKKK